MCDTIVALSGNTAEKATLFAKNSDRQRNEAQSVELFPAANHPPGSALDCTYIRIPQVPHTYAVLLCRPFWMWGAEMGANEHGVVAGNQSLHARSAASEAPALTGMDLVRLALERASSAAAALDVMIGLLEEHGQGGDCGHMVPYYYDNGFMIADATEAFVLETIGREWLVERVENIRTISNCFSIEKPPTRTSEGLSSFIEKSGWREEGITTLSRILADRQREERGQGPSRRARSMALLGARADRIELADLMHILRDHGPTEPGEWSTDQRLPYGLCLHAGTDDRAAQTTGALVSQLGRDASIHWITGTAAPCISIFKPVLIGTPFTHAGAAPLGQADMRVLWWRHERLHRAALMCGFNTFLEQIHVERDALEASFRTRIAEVLRGGNAPDRNRVIEACWQEANQMEDGWYARIAGWPAMKEGMYLGAWRKMNRIAGLLESQDGLER